MRHGSRRATGALVLLSGLPEGHLGQQRAWLARYFRSFESALYGPDFADPQAGYAAFLDVDSFIDAHWLIEMSKNVDGFRYSAFITKDRGGKLKTEPPWIGTAHSATPITTAVGKPAVGIRPACGRTRFHGFTVCARTRNLSGGAMPVGLNCDATHSIRSTFSIVDALAAQLDEAQKAQFQAMADPGRAGYLQPLRRRQLRGGSTVAEELDCRPGGLDRSTCRSQRCLRGRGGCRRSRGMNSAGTTRRSDCMELSVRNGHRTSLHRGLRTSLHRILPPPTPFP